MHIAFYSRIARLHTEINREIKRYRTSLSRRSIERMRDVCRESSGIGVSTLVGLIVERF